MMQAWADYLDALRTDRTPLLTGSTPELFDPAESSEQAGLGHS